MTTQLVIIEKGNELEALSTEKGIQSLIARAKEAVNNSDGGNLKTKTGRAKIRSNAFQATKLKTSMEKEAVKLIEGIEKNIAPELEKIVNIKKYSKQLGLGLDKVRADTNAEVKSFEDELQRIEDEKIEQANLEALSVKKESDHEIAIFLDERFDRDLAEAAAMQLAEDTAEVERLKQVQIDNDARIAKEAAEAATIKAERLAQKAIDDAQAAKQKAIDDKIKADNDLLESQAREKRLTEQAAQEKINQQWLAIELDAHAINDKMISDAWQKHHQELAEKARLASIEAERLAGIERQRLAQQAIDDEAARNLADVNHVRTINRAIYTSFIDAGLTKECATLATKALIDNKVSHTAIKY